MTKKSKYYLEKRRRKEQIDERNHEIINEKIRQKSYDGHKCLKT